MDVTTSRTRDLDQHSDGELLTLAEVADFLRVPVNTLRYWRQIGRGPRFFKMGRHLVTSAADLRTWVQSQKDGASPVA
ncbi:DNA-binding protein [Nocardioides mangrovicus]|uniref:DNA-binding protein n=1 Tax=Nocardioides mangrovicus TaxID=2478913 RepID=A0A3L8P2J7_9ACTN|nr:DNA-binding protein [Nocardioides mangrovicus]